MSDADRNRQPTRVSVKLPARALEVLERQAAAEHMTTSSFIEARLAELVSVLSTRRSRKKPSLPPSKPVGYL
jgi:hypothetical protein